MLLKEMQMLLCNTVKIRIFICAIEEQMFVKKSQEQIQLLGMVVDLSNGMFLS